MNESLLCLGTIALLLTLALIVLGNRQPPSNP